MQVEAIRPSHSIDIGRLPCLEHIVKINLNIIQAVDKETQSKDTDCQETKEVQTQATREGHRLTSSLRGLS